jgi:hypothetical protein
MYGSRRYGFLAPDFTYDHITRAVNVQTFISKVKEFRNKVFTGHVIWIAMRMTAKTIG